MKKVLALTVVLMVCVGIGMVFWYNEWVYSLPTPVPSAYAEVPMGTRPELPAELKKGKPVFLHFYNPGCPCSRFNVPEVRKLIKSHGAEIDFGVVVISDKTYDAETIRKKFDADLPVYFDASLAKSCGVYSTPQAVLIDKDGKLYYRGNYNRSRYCTDEKSNYARLAIESLLDQQADPEFNPLALKAYGCTLTCYETTN